VGSARDWIYGNDVLPGRTRRSKTLPPVKIELCSKSQVLALGIPTWSLRWKDILALRADGRNSLILRTTCAWSCREGSIRTGWDFLTRRRSNDRKIPESHQTSPASSYTFRYSGSVRSGTAANRVTARSGHWGRLLRSVRIPDELKPTRFEFLAELDARIIAADPKLAEIADLIGQATRIAIGEGPGAARLNYPADCYRRMLQRTGIVLRTKICAPGCRLVITVRAFKVSLLSPLPGRRSPTAAEAKRPELRLSSPSRTGGASAPAAARTLWSASASCPVRN